MEDKDRARRARENAQLIARMRAGESLVRISADGTWWQPRPMIKKDKEAVKRLFGEGQANP